MGDCSVKSFLYIQSFICTKLIFHTIHMYSGITRGRVLTVFVPTTEKKSS